MLIRLLFNVKRIKQKQTITTRRFRSHPAMPAHLDLAEDSADGRPQRGIQSIEVGGQVLRAMAHTGQPMALKDLAREADMPAAKIHPYLVSFARIGLMEQDAAPGRYFLGPLALQLGLISLKQANPVQAAAAELPGLVQRIGHTVAIAAWGTRGATLGRLEGVGRAH